MGTRAALLGTLGTAAVALVLGGAPAQAVPREVAYTCSWSFGTAQGTDEPAAASWDAHIPDDLVVPFGTIVPFGFAGSTVTLPTGLVDALRDRGQDDVTGSGSIGLFYRGNDEPSFSQLRVDAPVPAAGPMTVEVREEEAEDGILADLLGTYTLEAGRLRLYFPDLDARLECTPTDPADARVAAFEVVDPVPTTPSTTPSTTPPAVRPALVQTDVPEDERTSGVPAALLGVGALTAAALGYRLRRAGTSRRH